MTPITVCHIITQLELGGAQRNTLFTVSRLNQSRFRTVLVSGKGGILDAEAHALLGDRFHRLPQLVREIRPVRDLQAFFALKSLLTELRPDIVHTHSSKAGILGRLAARTARVPIVIHSIHGFGFTPHQHPVQRWFLIAAERVAARVTTRFFAVSAANRNQGITQGLFAGEQCAIVRSGIDLQAIRSTSVDKAAKKQALGCDPAEPLIGMVGPLKPQKAPLDFIRVAAKVHAVHPNVGIVLVGDGALRPAVEAEADRLGVGTHVKLLGWRHDVAEIMSCLDVFVLTSLWEGLPRVYLEALAAGVPVVGTRVDGAEEVITDGHNGFLLEAGDVDGIAERVVQLLHDHVLRAEMSRSASATLSAEFDIYEMVRQQEREYNRLLERAHGHAGESPRLEPRQVHQRRGDPLRRESM